MSSGRRRASIRAAAAATSGALARRCRGCATLPSTARAWDARRPRRDRGHRGVGAIGAAWQPERVRLGENGLRIGQVHLDQPGQEPRPRAVPHGSAHEHRTGFAAGGRRLARGHRRAVISQVRGLGQPWPAEAASAGGARAARASSGTRPPGCGRGPPPPPSHRQLGHPWRGPPSGQPVGDHAGIDLPGQVTEPVGQRGGQVPPSAGLSAGSRPRRPPCRAGPGHRRRARGPRQQGGLHGGRCGGQLIEEQQAAPVLGEPPRAAWRREPDSLADHDRQPGELDGSRIEAITVSQGQPGRFAMARIGGLAGSGRSPQQHRYPGGDRYAERFYRPRPAAMRRLPANRRPSPLIASRLCSWRPIVLLAAGVLVARGVTGRAAADGLAAGTPDPAVAGRLHLRL